MIIQEIEREQGSAELSHAATGTLIPARLRTSITQAAEIFIAASGVLALVGIVMLMSLLMRTVRAFHPR
jgi:hypothetical protein